MSQSQAEQLESVIQILRAIEKVVVQDSIDSSRMGELAATSMPAFLDAVRPRIDNAVRLYCALHKVDR